MRVRCRAKTPEASSLRICHGNVGDLACTHRQRSYIEIFVRPEKTLHQTQFILRSLRRGSFDAWRDRSGKLKYQMGRLELISVFNGPRYVLQGPAPSPACGNLQDARVQASKDQVQLYTGAFV